jgi:TRAP-type mannitol/chloroaromatic compound transport system substrate-binding protein
MSIQNENSFPHGILSARDIHAALGAASVQIEQYHALLGKVYAYYGINLRPEYSAQEFSIHVDQAGREQARLSAMNAIGTSAVGEAYEAMKVVLTGKDDAKALLLSKYQWKRTAQNWWFKDGGSGEVPMANAIAAVVSEVIAKVDKITG